MNNIDDSCMKSLGELAMNCSSLKEIDLTRKPFSKISITENGLKDLVQFMSGNTSLRILNFGGDYIWSEECIIHLIDLIKGTRICNVFPEHFDYEYPEGILLPLITNMLINRECTLDLSLKGINDEQISGICEIIGKHGKHIVGLKNDSLRMNNITSHGMKILFNTLKECNNLKDLDISENNFDDGCIVALTELLDELHSLSFLGMSDDYGSSQIRITDCSVDLLVHALLLNPIGAHLELYNHKGITDKSVGMLKELCKRTVIKQIDLEETSISEEYLSDIEELLKVPVDEREIPISSNTKSASKIKIQTTHLYQKD